MFFKYVTGKQPFLVDCPIICFKAGPIHYMVLYNSYKCKL